jgi:hypothetical protein
MYSNVGMATGLRPRVGRLGVPLTVRFEQMKREVEMAIPVGQPERAVINSMMSEIAIDQMEDAISTYRARKAAAEKPTPSVMMAIDQFIAEEKILIGVCQRLEASRKAALNLRSRWDVLLWGLDRTALEPVPVVNYSVDFVAWLKQQTADAVRAETQKLRGLRAILEARFESLEPILTFAAQSAADRCMQILETVVFARIENIERHLTSKANSSRKRKAKPNAAKAARKAK